MTDFRNSRNLCSTFVYRLHNHHLCQFYNNAEKKTVKPKSKRCAIIHYILTENEKEKIITHTVNVRIQHYANIPIIHPTHLLATSNTVKSHKHSTLKTERKGSDSYRSGWGWGGGSDNFRQRWSNVYKSKQVVILALPQPRTQHKLWTEEPWQTHPLTEKRIFVDT